MANLVTNLMFVAEINIPNNTSPEVVETINWLINKYEPEILEKLMGYELYGAYISNPEDQRIVDLISGVEYVKDDGTLAQWKGLKQSSTVSILANYIYYQWQVFNVVKQGGQNTVIPKGAMSINISPNIKMIKAWNDLVTQVRLMVQYLTAETVADTYPEYSSKVSLDALCFFRKINEFDL